MKIGVIKRSIDSYEQKKFVREINKVGKFVKINPEDVSLEFNKDLRLLHNREEIKLDAVIPRFTSKNYSFGLLIVKQLEKEGVTVVNDYTAIVNCKNKYLTNLLLKRKRISQPKSFIALSKKEMAKNIKSMSKPIVLKLLYGCEGKGIARINNNVEAQDWIDAYSHFSEPLYIQEYINHPGEDFRVFVIGDRVVGAMKRIARKGWKANFSLGSRVENYKPSKELKEIALKCKDAVKGDIVGVDLMFNGDIPEIIEMNCFPGFKGLEKACGKNICKEIVGFAKRKARK